MSLIDNFIESLENRFYIKINKNVTISNKYLGNGKINVNFEIDCDKLIDTLKSQQKKGIIKYGHTIDLCPDDKYNWEQMMLEEIADGIVYALKNQIVTNKKQNEK